jgi:hypothetical protein
LYQNYAQIADLQPLGQSRFRQARFVATKERRVGRIAQQQSDGDGCVCLYFGIRICGWNDQKDFGRSEFDSLIFLFYFSKLFFYLCFLGNKNQIFYKKGPLSINGIFSQFYAK